MSVENSNRGSAGHTDRRCRYLYYTITCSLSLISANSLQLQRPFLICTGRKILQDYLDFYAGDSTQGIVFKLTNVTINSSCKGIRRLQRLYPGPNSDESILPVSSTCYQEKLFVANGHAEQPCILVFSNLTEAFYYDVLLPLLSRLPLDLCLIDSHLFVSSGSHCIIKLTLMNNNEDVELRYTVENPSAGKSGWYRYVCKVSLSPSLQNRLLVTLNNSDLLVTRAILERSYLLFCAMRSCLTQITTEGNQ